MIEEEVFKARAESDDEGTALYELAVAHAQLDELRKTRVE